MRYPGELLEEDGFIPISRYFDEIVSRLAEMLDIAKRTESPIETILGKALHDKLESSSVFRGCTRWYSDALADGEILAVVAQYEWGRYRIDWAILDRDGPILFVECDGREFHSSDEAKARDRDRDAACVEAGINVLRFTGSEIFRTPDRCAAEIHLSIIDSMTTRRANGQA